MSSTPQPPENTKTRARRSGSIIATGAYLPERILTNEELEKMVDTSDEWIMSRTGIRERRIAAESESTSDMGAKAAQMALQRGGIDPEEIDLIIVATCTPDTVFPSTACHIQGKIGATRAAAFDLQAACAGFLYALITADQFISGGIYQTILVVGAEKLSSIVDWTDRNTCVLFGDGAGAVVLRPREGGRGLISFDLGADGTQNEILSLASCNVPDVAKNFIRMSGKEVYRQAVSAMNRSAESCLGKAGCKPEQIRWFIPHQANYRIVEAVAARMGVSLEHFIINLDRYGNMSSACIPVALHEIELAGRLDRGDLLLFVTFGGGVTWGSLVLEW